MYDSYTSTVGQYRTGRTLNDLAWHQSLGLCLTCGSHPFRDGNFFERECLLHIGDVAFVDLENARHRLRKERAHISSDEQ